MVQSWVGMFALSLAVGSHTGGGCEGGDDGPGGGGVSTTELPDAFSSNGATPEAGAAPADATTTGGEDASIGDEAASTADGAMEDATIASDATAAGDTSTADATQGVEAGGASVLTLDGASAAMAGNGCTGAGDTTLVVSGGALVATFRALAVELPVGGAQTAARSECSIRVPAHVPRGYYLAQLVQTFRYDAKTSGGASLSASTHVTLFSSNPAVLTQSWPVGTVVAATSATASGTDVAGPGSADYTAWCDPNRAEDDVLGIDVAVSAEKSDASANALVDIDEVDERSGIELIFGPC